MAGRHPFSELRDKMSPEAQARVVAKVKEMNMHVTTAKLKNGEVVEGILTLFRPADGYMLIYGTRINFKDALSITTEANRTVYGRVQDEDEIERARQYMKDARRFGWEGMTPDTPKQEWE